MADILGGIGGVLGFLDPTSKLVEMGAGALGLPPEVANAAKIGIGIAIANPIMVANGTVGLAGNALDNAAKTEFSPSKSDPGAGWGGGCGNEPPKGQADLNDKSTGFGAALFSIYRGGTEINRLVGEKIGEALLDGTHEEGWKKINNSIHGGADRWAANVLGVPSGKAIFEEKFACKVDSTNIKDGKIPFSADYSADWSNSQSPLDPNITKYREAIDTLRANWSTFDTAASGRDGLVTKADLAQIANNPNASEQMRQAARFLLNNPEYFNRLEMAAGVNGKDGLIGFIDLTAEVKRINADIKQFGVPGSLSSSGVSQTVYQDQGRPACSSGGSKVSSILNDPNLSLEEKIQAVLDAMLTDIDSELGATMQEYDAAMQGKADASKDPKKAQEAQGSIEKINRKLQQLMERRKQMTELASNMSKSFNDMSMVAIRNMR